MKNTFIHVYHNKANFGNIEIAEQIVRIYKKKSKSII